MDLIIKGGKIVTDTDQFIGDIGVKDGKIAKIGDNLSDENAEYIDASGKYVLPGMIDAHVHLSLPVGDIITSDTWESGTRAAAAAGITTIIDFATQTGDEPLVHAINERKAEADGEIYIDYSLHGGIAKWNSSRKAEIKGICESGITSFKMFMTYRSRGLLSTDEMITEAMEETKKYGGIILLHAEADDIIEDLRSKHCSKEEMEQYGVYLHVITRPNEAEANAIERAIQMVENSGGTAYIVHMSTKEGYRLVSDARKRGISVIGETCPQYLLLDESVFKRENGHLYATCPQVKTKQDSKELWEGLANGSLNVIGTDNCTFSTDQKALWKGDYRNLPMGMPGIELMVPLIHSEGVEKGILTINQMVAIACTNPAKIYGLFPRKGALMVGSDADIVVFDPKKEYTVDFREMETNCDWNPYQGMKIKGRAEVTILRGKVVGRDGKCVGNKGYGMFIPRAASGNKIP